MGKTSKTNPAKYIIFIALFLSIAVFPQNTWWDTPVLATVDQEAVASSEPALPERDGVKCNVVSYVYTTEKKFAITFSGMADSQNMNAILDELDKYNMKGLFFLPGMRVAEEPDIAKEILARGHEIGNDTLNDVNLTTLTEYDDIYNELKKANDVIKEKTGVTPKYFSNRGWNYNDTVLEAAEDCGLALVKYTINLQNWGDKSAKDIQSYLLNKITRGGVISLGTDDLETTLESIRMIAQAADTIGYSVAPMELLLAGGYERKPLSVIEGSDAPKINADYSDAQINLVYNGKPSSKMVVLTFDDWGSDWAVTRLLDILKEYNVKATFFLRADGVEENPNLAKAIADDGHDVGNHTYDHPKITSITYEQLQQEIVKAHQIIAEAIQKEPTLYFRPPSGEINDTVLKAIAACGYTYTSMYDLDPKDWEISNTKDDILESVKKQVTGGNVVLLHLEGKFATYEALPDIIEYLESAEYSIVPLSELITSGNANIFHGLPAHTPGT